MQYPTWFLCVICLLAVQLVAAPLAVAGEQARVGPTGLPLPRFVSLKASRANVRVGPGKTYAILFTYEKKGLPVEIINEYDQWRQIRDSQGAEGWIFQSLLSSRRTALVSPWQKDKSQLILLHKTKDQHSAIVAKLEPGVLGDIETCDGSMCQIMVGRVKGWLAQEQIWGAYPDESIKE